MKKKEKEKRICKNCAKEFELKRNCFGLYCSTYCQHEYERKEKIKEWLRTGECTPGSNRRHYVRLYLLRDQKEKCQLCECPTTWQGKELALVLDHVNGNSSDNRRENLRLICPNCDSQLSTYKSRNRGNGRHTRRQRYQEGKSY